MTPMPSKVMEMASENGGSSGGKKCKRLRLRKAERHACNHERDLKVRKKDLKAEVELVIENSGKVEVASENTDGKQGKAKRLGLSIELNSREELKVRKKDLKSDEAVWNLYKRWCDHFEISRTHEQMEQRFEFFKKTVISIHKTNKKKSSVYVALNHMSDNTPEERKRRFTSLGIKCSVRPC